MALTAFKSIHRLSLYSIPFTTFGHCSRLIRAFPYLNYLSFGDNRWKPKHPSLPLSYHASSNSASRRRLQLAHLDVWGKSTGDSDLHEFSRWLIDAQTHNMSLRTLSVLVDDQCLLPNILRHCGSHVCSIFLMILNDSPIPGNHAHLQTIHALIQGDMFPVEAVKSIVLSATSRQLRHLTLYMRTGLESKAGSETQNKEQNSITDDFDEFAKLDAALCNPLLKKLKITLCLYGPGSAGATASWQQRLSVRLPKFCNVEGRFRVESTPTKIPYPRWMDLRDGFW